MSSEIEIGNDCWDLIFDYKAQLEHRDKFKECVGQLNQIMYVVSGEYDAVVSVTDVWYPLYSGNRVSMFICPTGRLSGNRVSMFICHKCGNYFKRGDYGCTLRHRCRCKDIISEHIPLNKKIAVVYDNGEWSYNYQNDQYVRVYILDLNRRSQ